MPRRRKSLSWIPLHGDIRRCAAALEGDDLHRGLRACQELLNLIAIHEERLVRAARAEGMSWHTIAFYLGVSYQAVHRKWRRRLQGNAYDPNSGRRKDKWIEKYGAG